MAKNLLIVESPAKAKTIEKFLGKDFKVKSSYGHIRDLDKGSKGISIEQDFEPHYVVSPEKKKVVKELKAEIKKASEVWLATDEDREGEAISWHLCQELGLDVDTTKRIVFREITKPAVQKAIQNPRKVDLNLVNAQQARRILDRLVGFELSGVLWRKVKNKLSAGRVQSVAVKLIVEKEREIIGFESSPYFKVSAVFDVKDTNGYTAKLKAELTDRLTNEEEAKKFLEGCVGADYKIIKIEVKPTQRKPAPPFTTSTLQQEASRKLGFSVNRTMSNAQRLYEQGFITYMRTDSTSLSDTALGALADEIQSNYGEEYVHTRKYKSKSANAQEAHEAIRPTYIDRRDVTDNRDQQRLYELIYKRTIACQMSNAKLEKTNVDISISSHPDRNLRAKGEVLKFDGFLKVYMESKDEDDDTEDTRGILPPLSEGQELDLDVITALQRFTRPPARYTEASLVKKLEELGIGRPSTYAPTITKIMEEARGYVTKESREGVPRAYQELTLKGDNITAKALEEITGSTSNRLYATDMGKVVTDFLDQHFDEIMNYGFTAEMESKFDKIAEGHKEWKAMIKTFYGPFHTDVEETLEKAERAKGRRDLGIDPESGHTVMVQLTRYGPVIQIGTVEEVGEEGKPKFANLRPGQSMESISYDEAMKLFELPKNLGDYEDKEVIIGAGRYGPYVKYNEKFISLPKGMDPMEVKMDTAIELIEQKKKEDAPIATYEGKPVTKGKGRFGPYLKWEKFFVNVPKRYDFDNLAPNEINELIAAKIEKEANRYIKQWPDEGIAIENGRWGPFFRVKKKSVKIPKVDDKKLEKEDLEKLSLEDVKKLIKQAQG